LSEIFHHLGLFSLNHLCVCIETFAVLLAIVEGLN